MITKTKILPGSFVCLDGFYFSFDWITRLGKNSFYTCKFKSSAKLFKHNLEGNDQSHRFWRLYIVKRII